MKCKDVKCLLPEFTEDILSSDDKIIVSQHLDNCRNCSAEYRQVVGLYARLKIDSPTNPPESYWNNLIPRIHKRIDSKPKNALEGLFAKISIPAAAALLALFVVIHMFSVDTVKIQPVFSNQTELNGIINELTIKDVESLSNEEMNLLTSLDQKEDNGSDKYVLNKILNEQKSVVESDYVNVESALKIMDDDELNKLISYLDQSKN
jgi:arsenate reductase-like glutaredoxin family protein